MPSQSSARVIPFRCVAPTADLSEALDALDLVGEVLRQTIGRRAPSAAQRAALGVVDGLQHKHNRATSAA